MNVHFAQGRTDDPRAAERRNMRALALQLRRNSHQYRAWGRDAAAQGHAESAAIFAARADRYIADALWYWRRSYQ
jgi:hypothetical protein